MKFSDLALVLLAVPALLLAKAPAGQSPVLPTAAPVATPSERPADPSLPRPRVGAPGAWVEVLPLPKAPSDVEGSATIQLLGDLQVRFTKTRHHLLRHVVANRHCAGA